MSADRGVPASPFATTAQADAGAARKKPSGLQVAGLALVLLIVLWKVWPDAPTPLQQAVAPPTVGNTVDVSNMSREALDTQRQVEIDAIKQRLARQEEQIRALPEQMSRKLSETENKMTRDLQGIVSAIETQADDRTRRQRATGMSLPRLPSSAAPGQGDVAEPSDGVVDITLPNTGGSFANAGTTWGGQYDLADESFPYRRLGGAPAPSAPTLGAGPNTLAGGFIGSPSSAAPAAAPAGLPAIGTAGAPAPMASAGIAEKLPGELVKPPAGGVVIPAYSHVEMRALHGATCPLRSSATASLGLSSAVTPIPFVITGAFRGPQGVEYQTPSVHVMGLCEGVDRMRPTGMIKIESLSMVLADGSNYKVPINGYVIDARDNDLGLRGVKESVKGKQVALSILSAGIGGVGEVAGQSAFDSVETQGGNIRQIFRGSRLTDALLGKTASAAATEAADFFRKNADSLFDVISINANIPAKLYVESPIQMPAVGDSDDVLVNAKPLI